MTEWLHFHFSLSCIGEGNGNPLQCSCLENPRDGGPWWAAIYGVAQSQTQLKRLSCSSSSRTLQEHVKGRRAERLGGKRTYRQHEKVKQMAEHAYLDWIKVFKMPNCNQKVIGTQYVLIRGRYPCKRQWKGHKVPNPCLQGMHSLVGETRNSIYI